MMRDILTGGACNVNGESSSQVNQNPFNRMMGSIFTGQAQNAERMQNFQRDGPQGDLMKHALAERGQMMLSMNKEFDNLNRDFDEKININSMMEKNFMQSQSHMNQQHAHFNHIFMHEQNLMAQEARNRENFMNHQLQMQQLAQSQQMQQMNAMMNGQFEQAKQEQDAEAFANELLMDKGFEDIQKQALEEEAQQQIIKQSVNEIYDKMAQDSSPRIKNSKFLQFMSQIKTGELKIEGDQLVKGEPEIQDATFNNAWNTAQEEQKTQEQDMENAFDLTKFWQSQLQDIKKQQETDPEMALNLENGYGEAVKQMNLTDEQLDEDQLNEQLQKDYEEALKSMEGYENYEHLQKAWQNDLDLEGENMNHAADFYQFQQNNPYLNSENPLHLALEFITQGKIIDAILALEAQLQKNPNSPSNSNSWRILGRLHQENDLDQKAVACFLNALKKDDTNPDTFLALGVSCTNILDEVKAMNFLKRWYLISGIQNQVPINPELVPEDKKYQDFSLEQIKSMNQDMLNSFMQARNVIPNNPELHVSIAVLQYISRDYQGSVDSFREALKYDPNNYSLWNKLGATLAQLGRSDEAIDAYHKALELKPNYVRVWVNLGIAYAYKQDYQEASKLYLNALSFNPDAQHLWSYLQTCFMCLQRYDLVEKISHHNPALFADEFEVLKLEDLPQPEYNYNEATKKYLISQQEINQWLKEFNN